MACSYDAEQQLLSLAFAVVAGEESVTYLGIRAVFERLDFGR
jgi:hypothetical protein